MRRVATPSRVAVSAAAAGLMVASLVGSVGAQAAPAGPKTAAAVPISTRALGIAKNATFTPGILEKIADKPQTVFVQLTGQGAADMGARATQQGQSTRRASATAKDRRVQVRASASSVTAEVRKQDPSARELFHIANTVPGVAIRANRAALQAISRRPDVVRISVLTPHTFNNAGAAQLTKVLDAWQSTGLTGKGVKIGIIDSGVDYTHADFGGPGTPAAYDKAHATADSGAPWKPTAKVVGGFDFVGDSYNPDPQAESPQFVPHPDPNPLDCVSPEGNIGHGTHVAGTAAGLGVTGAGKTFTGRYSTLTKTTLKAMRIGPGMAPLAKLYALRVFGCFGPTYALLPALDRALDPNGDGDFADHLDIVNLSLGSSYGAPDNPEDAVVNSLARHGIIPVLSAGNSGDVTDAAGSPGNAARALEVASSVDSFDIVDGLVVKAPAKVAGTVAAQVSSAYPWATAPDVTGTVATLTEPGNLDGCDPLSSADAARVRGKVAWLEWDDDDATRRCGSAARSGNVATAGAVGAIFTTKLPQFTAGILGSATIPVVQLTAASTDRLRAAAAAGTLKVTFTGSLLRSVKTFAPAAADLISDFSSRGTHGSPGVVKPDVAAPGSSIISAAVGTGNDWSSLQGTSMASPHTAGIAALVKQRHPSWTVEQVKAAVMNTAVHDLYTKPDRKGLRYGPARDGAGRVDARYAVSTSVLAYGLGKPGGVSVSFGVVEAPSTHPTVTRTQSVRIRNKSFSSKRVALSYDPVVRQPGVSYSVSRRTVTVKPRSKVDVTVTMTISTRALRRTIDPTMSTTLVSGLTGESGFRQFVSDASGHLLVKPTGHTALRVPVYGAARPVSVTTAAAARPGGKPVIALTGRGVNQGSGTTAYQSKVSVLNLGATSRRLPQCAARETTGCVLNRTASASDLRYVGAGAADGFLWFGVSTWGPWASLAQGYLETDVAIDTTGDGDLDYVVAAYVPDDSDQPVALLLDATDPLKPPVPVSALPVNFLDGRVDTNAYDSDAALIPVRASDLGITSATSSFPIQYEVVTFNEFGEPDGGFVDETPMIAFDAANPAIATQSPLYFDGRDQSIPYTTAPPAGVAVNRTARTNLQAGAAASSVNALVLHLSGRTGHRAEVVALPR